jgi:hypothetical protein
MPPDGPITTTSACPCELLPFQNPVGAENSSTSGDLDVLVDQPTETIDP